MPMSDLVDNPAEIQANWPTKPVLFHRDPANFHHLLTLTEVDELIDTGCVAARNTVLIREGKVLERYEYADTAALMPRPGVIRTHISNGGSLSLRSLETMKPAVARLQREIQAETAYMAHVNAYLTPGNQQGLRYHYDPYVTLIVQLNGHKTWPLHPPVVENPVEEYGNFRLRGWTDEDLHHLATTPPAESITLSPGDVFWLPRGWAHAPYTHGEETSLHLTFAFKQRTLHWAAEEIARIALGHALTDPAARAEIPPSDLLDGPAQAVKWAREYLIGAMIALNTDETAATLRSVALDEARLY